MKTLIICKSIHHKNTRKIAEVFSEVLATQVTAPEQLDADELRRCDLVGIGSGIYAGRHHDALLEIVGRLPVLTGKLAFVFSTSAIVTKRETARDHEKLRELLESRGYRVVDEFSCPGFNTNSFMKYSGGMNRGRPNAQDLEHAREFASNLKRQAIDP